MTVLWPFTCTSSVTGPEEGGNTHPQCCSEKWRDELPGDDEDPYEAAEFFRGFTISACVSFETKWEKPPSGVSVLPS